MIKFLIILVCIYLLIRWIAPTVLRFFVKRMFKKMGQNGGRYQYEYRFGREERSSGPRQSKKKGNVNIDYVPKKKKPIISDNEGEYVDYEEIK